MSRDVINNGIKHVAKESEKMTQFLRRSLECSSKRFKPAKSKNENIQLNSIEWETRSNTFFLNALHYRWECICTLTVWKGPSANIWRPEDFCCSGMVGLAGRPSTLVGLCRIAHSPLRTHSVWSSRLSKENKIKLNLIINIRPSNKKPSNTCTD